MNEVTASQKRKAKRTIAILAIMVVAIYILFFVMQANR
jgi:hypothetical protein